MGLTNRIKRACGIIANTLIDGLAMGLNAAGSIICYVGGGGIAVSNSLSEVLETGYYGNVAIKGDVNLKFTVIEANYSYNQTIPFQHNLLQTSEGHNYTVADLANPDNLYMVSSVLIVSGTVLRTLAANLRVLQQGRADKVNYGDEIQSPSLREYASANAESFFYSLSIASCSAFLTKIALDYALLELSLRSFTYPTHSNSSIVTTHYHGPTESEEFPFDFAVSQNSTFQIFKFLSLTVREDINASALITVTYGGGMVIRKSPESSLPLELTSAAVGTTTYLIGTFFGRNAQKHRDLRIIQGGTLQNKVKEVSLITEETSEPTSRTSIETKVHLLDEDENEYVEPSPPKGVGCNSMNV